MASLNSNSITGITTTIFDSNSAVNKTYIDTNVPVIPSAADQKDKVLVSIDGTNSVWREVSNYSEYITSGSYTFNVPDLSTLFYVESMSGGEGGAGPVDGSAEPTVWSRRSLPNAYYPYGPSAYGNGIHAVAGSSSDRVMFSTDLIVWSVRTIPNESNQAWVAYANNIWFGGGYERLSTSTDTITWIMRTVNGISSYGGPVTDVLWDGAYYIILGGRASSPRMNASTDSIHWVMRTGPDSSHGQYYRNIKKEGNTYVLSTGNGYIATSTDGIAWTKRTSPNNGNLGNNNFYKGLNFDGNIWMHPYNTNFRTSTDAIHWTLRTAGNSSNLYDTATNGAGISIMSGNGGYRATSTDAIHWTRRTGNSSDLNSRDFYTCGYGGGRWSWYCNQNSLESSINLSSGAGGAGGNYASWYIPKRLVTSNTMTIQVGRGGSGNSNNVGTNNAGAGTTISWTGPGGSMSVTSNGGFGASQEDDIYKYSPGSASSGIQTTFNQATGGGKGAFGDSALGDSGGQINFQGITTFAAAGQDGPNTFGFPFGPGGGGGNMISPPPYSAWTARTTGYAGAYTGVGYAFGLWTVFAGGNTYRTSTDSINWRARTTGSGGGTYNMSFGYNGSDLAILGQENGLLRSTTDAIHFTARTTGLGQSSNLSFSGYLNNLWFAAGQQGKMAVSTDAIHWTIRTTGSSNDVNQIAYGSANYIFSDDDGRAASSTDTIHWISRTVSIASGGRLEGASHSSELGLYFISGRRSYSAPYNAADFGAASTDTIHWTLRTLSIDAGYLPARSIFADGIFTLVTDQAQGRLVTSTDSIHWTKRTSNGKNARGIVRNSNGEYGIAGGSGFFSYLKLNGATAGGDGFRGGGGGGGACSEDGSSTSSGGNGGDGYVKITWY